MGLFCRSDSDYDSGEWWWYAPAEEAPLATKRSRKCCSCGEKISVGSVSREIRRYRPPTEFEEDRGICYDEVPLPSWYFCETCGDLADSISELGFCYTLNKNLKTQIREYMSEEHE